MDRHIKKILNRTPKVQDVPHVFWSYEAHVNTGGETTARVKDEFGQVADVNFVGGISINEKGRIIPPLDEMELDARPESYEFLGYMDDDGVLIRSDHAPEIPRYYTETGASEGEGLEL